MVSQIDAWEAVAERWAGLVRGASFSAEDDAFFALLPPPGRLALDIGCGEGRVARRLSALGYAVIGVDASPTLVGLAQRADRAGDYRVADAAELPFADGSFDLVVLFMSLQDMDDPVAAMREAGRVLEPGGTVAFAIIHPFWTAGLADEEGDRFVIGGSYLDVVPHVRPEMQVPSVHRPLEQYFRGLEAGGLAVETLRELPLPRRLSGRLPVYLHATARKP